MSTLFSGAGGGELGDSSSVSLLLLLEVTFVFPFLLGVARDSSFSEFSLFSSLSSS